MNKHTKKLVTASVMAALCAVATMAVAIPSPAQGYVNLGDCIVLLCGWFLGPWWGMAAAGIGSAMADVMLSYAIYAPGTLIIKGLMAMACGLIGARKWGRVTGGVVAEVIMVVGYALYAGLVMGDGAWIGSVVGNCFQGVVGVTSALLVYQILGSKKRILKLS